jgi:membrane protease YdiL (CAAX protease family)
MDGTPTHRRLLAFMVLACGYSWTLWALMMASAQGWLPFHFPTNFLGSFGPSLAGLVLAAREGRAKALLRSAVQWRFRGRWYAVALLGPPLLLAAALGLAVLLGQVLPAPANLDKAALLPLLFVVILVLGGPLGEEFGWRGFLLPELLKTRGPLAASLWVAAAWFLWHVPLFWLEGAAQKGSSMVLFGASVMAFSVLFTWIYLGTGRSLLAALLVHTMVNLPSFCLSSVYPDVEGGHADAFLTGLLTLAAAAVVLAKWPGVPREALQPPPNAVDDSTGVAPPSV